MPERSATPRRNCAKSEVLVSALVARGQRLALADRPTIHAAPVKPSNGNT